MTERPTLSAPLKFGAKIGILGGGQLGRMLSLSAARLGFQCIIYDPKAKCPAADCAAQHIRGDYTDTVEIKKFAALCDVVTYEFENVPAETALAASQIKPLSPNALALDVAQDRLTEKTFIRDIAGVPVADFVDITTRDSLDVALEQLGYPAILKTRRLGYDGKGQSVLNSPTDRTLAFQNLKGVAAILEKFVPFVREVSIIAARSASGEFKSYPLVENIHRHQILHKSLAPAQNDSGQAQKLAKKIMEALDYVGVMATEFFELSDGTLIVNEIAPRVHNSGHWTQDAGCIDQFELHIRAIAGWPLGDTNPKHSVEMTNLLGQDIDAWEAIAREPGTFLHMYGKSDPRKGRKMGHVNRIVPKR